MFLARSVVVAFFAALTVAPVQAAEVDGPKITWNHSYFGAKGRAVSQSIETMARVVGEKTGGNFKIEVHYGSLSQPAANLDGLKLGAFQIARHCAGYAPAKTPAAGILELPFMPVGDLDVQQRVHEAVFAHPHMAKELGQWNAQYLMGSLFQPYHAMGKGEPPVDLLDWKGMRIRAVGEQARAAQMLKAVPTTMPASELYTSIQRGLIVGGILPIDGAKAYNLQEVLTWYMDDLAMAIVSCFDVVNRDAWAALPPQYRKLVLDTKAEAYGAQKAALLKEDAAGREVFAAAGIKRIVVTPAQREALKKVVDPLWAEWLKRMQDQNIDGKSLLDVALKAAGAN